MDYNKKGWLSNYLDIKRRGGNSASLETKFRRSHHPDHTLYTLIQPTGIMYGYPLKKLTAHEKIDDKTRVRLLLIDTLITSYLLFIDETGSKMGQFEENVDDALQQIGTFYNEIYPELYTNTTTFFGQKRQPVDVVEKILEKRINMGKQGGFWAGFFHNSLLFIDIYFFRQWVHTANSKIIIDYLKNEKDTIRGKVIKVMSAAAYANENIEAEERKLFEYFVSSLKLSSEKKKEAKIFFEKGYSLNELDIYEDQSWILKKYFLELSILTAWADRKVEDTELEYLKMLNEKLGFTDDDFEHSMIAVEGFVLNYWNEMEKLQSKKDFEIVSHHYTDRVMRIISKNREQLYDEIYKRGSLLKLIKKAKTAEVTSKEQDFIRDQLIDSFEELPAFEIVSLPRNFLTFKLLMSILPDDFFKSI